MSQLLRNVLSLYVVRLIGVATAVVLFPIIVGAVGLSHAGIWLLISSVSIFFATSDFGLGTSVVRYVADARARADNAEVNAVICSSLAALAALGALAAVAFAAFFGVFWSSFNIPAGDRDVAAAMVGIVALGHLALALPLNVFRQVLTGAQRMDLSNGIVLLQTLLRVGLVIAALALGGGIVGVVVAEVTAVALTSVLAALTSFRLIPTLSLRPRFVKPELLREMAPYSAKVFLLGLSGLIVLQSSNAIVAAFLPVAAVALYGSAFRIYTVCRDVTSALQSAVVPDAAQAVATGDHARLRDLMIRGTKYGNAVLLLIGIPTMVFAEPLLLAWVGPRFADADVIVQILIAGLIVNNNHIVAVGLLTGTGNVSRVTAYHLIWALTSVGLAIVLVTTLGLPGVALAIGLPLLLLEPFYLRLACREFDLSGRRFVTEAIGLPLAAAGVAGSLLAVIVQTYSPSALPAVLAASLVYALVFVGGFTRLGMDAGERQRMLRLPRLRVGA